MSEGRIRVKKGGQFVVIAGSAIAQTKGDATISGDMAYESFGDFIEALDKAGELRRITEPVATELEITVLADAQMKMPRGRQGIVDRATYGQRPGVAVPGGHQYDGFGKRMAIALGAESVEAVAAELGSLMKAKPPTSVREAMRLLGTALELRHARPKRVRTGPCKEVVRTFEAGGRGLEPWPAAPRCRVRMRRVQRGRPTLLEMPILKCWPWDGGRFITLPCVVTRDPDTGERNVGMYRMQVYDDRSTGMHWQLQKVGARHGRRYYESGERMPVAVFLGGDPAYTFAATAPLPDGLDEMLLAGYLRRKSVELVKCETVDLEVPANADWVLEGYVDPKEPLREEGPFGITPGSTRCRSLIRFFT
jgi:4-hydroxy-3-polyprenylbenzoate decarboxylase